MTANRYFWIGNRGIPLRRVMEIHPHADGATIFLDHSGRPDDERVIEVTAAEWSKIEHHFTQGAAA
jgi:hypothetical protein